MKLIQMENITKIYPGTIALNKVNFFLNQGEIVSMLGENGAGKTTLMKILYGMTSADEGKIYYKGKEINLKKPVDAINMGICMVHQHFMLVPAFTVTENIVVGCEPNKKGFLDNKEARDQVTKLIQKFNFNMNPDTKVSDLSVGEQQRVEILKALYRKADVIILDEPTAVLTPTEVDELFVILRNLKEEGKSIIIITHKLRETKALADRVTVLRDGNLIEENVDPKQVSTEELSEMMVGRKVDLKTRRPAKSIGDVIFKLKNLTVEVEGHIKVNNVSLGIRQGEILGIAGIEGNGQTQLIEALTGLIKPNSMELTLKGKKLSGNSNRFLRNGVGHIPEDRLSLGLVKEMSVKENLILGYHREHEYCKPNGFLKQQSIKEIAKKLKDEFMVKAPSVDTSISSLSGGNQQKVVIARTFSHDPEVIIIAHPTRGVDIGAMEYIHQEMIRLRDNGKAILLISADLDEVRALSDRILVLYEGKIVSESMPDELSEVELGLLMTGSKKKEEAMYG